jgi:hypothetical protein
MGLIVWRGGPFDNWDLEVHGGIFGSARVLMAVEDHGSGTQYVRVGIWPRFSRVSLALIVVGLAFAALSARDGSFVVTAVFGLGSLMLGLRNLQETGYAFNAVETAMQSDEAVK